jgi:integrase
MKLSEATVKYINSTEWDNLSARSRYIYNNGIASLKPLMDEHVKSITRRDVLDFRDSLHHMPGKCRVALMALNNIFRYLLDRGEVNFNPAVKVNGLPPSKPIARWEEWEIDKFLETAPAYLRSAMLLALYTGQRLSDLVRMRWEEYDGTTIKVKQQKTGKELLLPVHPRLKADLDAREVEAQNAANWRPFILWGAFGHPLTAGALASGILRHARKIGLKGRTIHGVRKACASILAESGCSPSEIMAITGHTSLKEVQRYTLEANQLTMAKEALRKWKNKHEQPEAHSSD